MTALLLHLVSCAFMTGLIWVIQILHYPAFAKIQAAEFPHFHSQHSRRISFIVGPVMGLELVTSFIVLDQFRQSLLVGNIVLLFLIWLCTAFLSVPLHNKLAQSQDAKIIAKLVLTNWPRTILWSLRLVGLTIYFLKLIGSHYVNLSA